MSADDSQSGGSGGGGGSGNSFAAQHAVAPRHALKVAPTDGSTKFNTIRIPLIPVACWRLNDPAFAFDSSFVSPSFKGELGTLSGIVSANQGCPAALFGHCDPAGSDALNKTLGDRRAIAIYALLTRQPDLWAYLYDNTQVGDTWDLRMVQTMVACVQDAQGNPYYAGLANGTKDSDTTDAVKRFQGDSGLSADGDPGSDTRKVLYGAYMDWLCTPLSASPPPTDPNAPGPIGPTPFRMQPTDFLGGTGAQAGDLPKMSLQSCGKFNPIVLLTTGEMGGEDTTDGASKTQRNADDAPNRRVIMFFFDKGTKVDASIWPCPKVKETNDACKDAFWPDGDSRRKNGDTKRLYKVTRDTMACRFYDRFARRSRCESVQFATLRIWLQDTRRQLMPNSPYRLDVCGEVRTGNADTNGLLVETNVPRESTCALAWGDPSNASPEATSDDAFLYHREINIDPYDSDPVARDLYNLAYFSEEMQDELDQFSVDYPGQDATASVPQVHYNGTPKKSSAAT